MKVLTILIIAVSLPLTVVAEETLRFENLNARIGLTDTGISFLGRAFNLAVSSDIYRVTPEIEIVAGLNYWSKGKSYDLWGTVSTAEVSVRTFSIEGLAKYNFATVGDRFRPFAAGGLALHFIEATGEVVGPYAASESAGTTKLGLDVCGGAEYALQGAFDLVGEIKFVTIEGDLRSSFQVGAIYKF